MKKYIYLVLSLLLVFTLAACSESETKRHSHSFSDATCTEPQKCSCGQTNGDALGHTWADATCTTPKTCTVCSATEGDALGHTWVEANCTTPKTCSVCSATEGDALGHTWVEANCTTPKTCSVCSATEGDVAHNYVYGVCQLCKKTEIGLILDHRYYIVTHYPSGRSVIEAYHFGSSLYMGISAVWDSSHTNGFDPIYYNGKVYYQGGVGGPGNRFVLTDTSIIIYASPSNDVYEILTVNSEGNLVTTYSPYGNIGEVWLKELNYTKYY